MLATGGAKVVVNDIGTSVHGEGTDHGPTHDTVAQIRAAGGHAVASTNSVAQWNSAKRIAELAMDTYGRIDGVVYNRCRAARRDLSQDGAGRLGDVMETYYSINELEME